MRKNIAGLLMAVLFVPAVAMAQFHGNNHGSANNNSSYQHPGSTGSNNTHGHTSNSGNGSSYNGNTGHNNSSSHNSGSNYGPGSNNSNHGNSSSYGNGSNHGNNNGNSSNHSSGNSSSGHPGHIDNSGHDNPGFPGHGSSAGKELMMAHYNIERAFQDAENSYYPYFMSEQDKRNMLFAMRRIKFEFEGLLRLVDRRHRDEIHQISIMVERSIFTMVAENNVKEAHRMLKRTEDQYKRTAVEIFRR